MSIKRKNESNWVSSNTPASDQRAINLSTKLHGFICNKTIIHLHKIQGHQYFLCSKMFASAQENSRLASEQEDPFVFGLCAETACGN